MKKLLSILLAIVIIITMTAPVYAGTIYEDVEALTERVAELETQVTALTPLDSGWLDLTLSNGAVAYNTAQRPQYRKIGNHIYIRGVLKNVTTFPTTVAQLPDGFRPAQRIIYFLATNGPNTARLEIETNGIINIVASDRVDITSSTHYSFGTLQFLID